jgi:hypothetical protein
VGRGGGGVRWRCGWQERRKGQWMVEGPTDGMRLQGEGAAEGGACGWCVGRSVRADRCGGASEGPMDGETGHWMVREADWCGVMASVRGLQSRVVVVRACIMARSMVCLVSGRGGSRKVRRPTIATGPLPSLRATARARIPRSASSSTLESKVAPMVARLSASHSCRVRKVNTQNGEKGHTASTTLVMW